jgi:putative transposase
VPPESSELLKLGIEVAERTVSRLMWRVPNQSPPDLISLDFLTVPTARLRVLFVFVVLAHDRRRVLHFNVTEHPTAVAGVGF